MLDTNVVAVMIRPNRNPHVLPWADGLDPGAVAIMEMTVTFRKD